MAEGFLDKQIDNISESINKYRWEKIDYTCDGQKYELYFTRDGKLIIDSWNDVTYRDTLDTVNRRAYNTHVWALLNMATWKEPPNRPTIWAEVNAIYDEFFWEERENILENTREQTTEIIDEIKNKWNEIIDDIESFIDEWYFVLRMLFMEFYKEFTWKEIKDIDTRWMDLIYNREFMTQLYELSQEIWCNTEDLIFVMYCESKLDPKAVNKYSDATWLLQWLPSTAKWLWTTTEKLLELPAKDQLIYVYKFLQQNDRGKVLDTPQKLYASVFYPKYLEHINEPEYIFGSHVSKKNALKIANQNPAIVKYSRRKINWEKVIDWYAFNRYVNAQKNEFDRKLKMYS
jgi:hypothetical protein